MSIMQSELFNAGIFFLFIFLSGFWLNRKERPYNVLIVTIHKLIGLALGVYLGSAVFRVHRAAPLTSTQIIVIVVTILFFAVNVATGSLLSANKPMPKAVTTMNKTFPYLTVVTTGVLLYLLS